MTITTARVLELFRYNPATGSLRWKVSVSNKIKVRSEAGTDDGGYRRVMVDGHSYYAHVLVWVIMTGGFPTNRLDHKDLNKSNNRWNNLRLSNNSLNTANRHASVSNTSGHKGVSWHATQQKWRADITVAKKKKFLGCFTDKKRAASAYAEAANRLFGEFART